MNRYDLEDPYAAGETNIKHIRILDRTRGSDKTLAWCSDKDQAQRIVDLLNASDEKRKEPR